MDLHARLAHGAGDFAHVAIRARQRGGELGAEALVVVGERTGRGRGSGSACGRGSGSGGGRGRGSGSGSGRRGGRRARAEGVADVLDAEEVLGGRHDRHREDVLELANVERPAVRDERRREVGRDAQLGRAVGREARQEIGDQEPEVGATIAQRHEPVHVRSDACVEVGAEGGRLLDRLERRGDDAEVDRHRLRRAER